MNLSIRDLFSPPESFSDSYIAKRAVRIGNKVFQPGARIEADTRIAGSGYILRSAYKDDASITGNEREGVFEIRTIRLT